MLKSSACNKYLRIIFPLVLILLAYKSKSQFYNLPGDYSFSLLTEKRLAKKDSSIHSGIKPYIHFFSNRYVQVVDSHRVFNYITNDPLIDIVFYKHLICIEPAKQNFKFRLDPLLNIEVGKDFSDPVNRILSTNTRGFIGCGYVGSNVYFETLFAENQSLFPNYIASSSKSSSVIPGQGRWKTFRTDGYDYAFSSGFVSIQTLKNLNIQFGHGKQKIGNGYRSLFLSDNAFNYPYARFTQQWFKGRIQYNNIYAVLMNLDSASKTQNPNAERLFQKKPASFQYLSINVTKGLNIGFFQSMIWQAGDGKNKQNLTWQYFNPLIYSNLASYQLNNKNNLLIGLDAKLKVSNQLNIYGQAMVDDLSNSKKTRNGWGYQSGIMYFNALGVKNLFIQIEWNSVTESSYFSPIGTLTNQSYSHYNQNLAYTLGSGNELIVIGDYKWRRFFVTCKYNYQRVMQQNENYYWNNIVSPKIGYVINPAYNLNVSMGVNYRLQNFYNFKALSNETSYIYFGIKTSLYNLYYDF